MARLMIVKAARKPQGNCRVCGKSIEAGMPYKWTKPRKRGKIAACSTCHITRSMTSSSKMVPLLDALDTFGGQEEGDYEGLASDLDSLAEEARNIGEEYQESADNQREYFPDAEVAEQNEEKHNELDEWAASLERAASEVRSKGSEVEGEEDEEKLTEAWEEAERMAEDATGEFQG